MIEFSMGDSERPLKIAVKGLTNEASKVNITVKGKTGEILPSNKVEINVKSGLHTPLIDVMNRPNPQPETNSTFHIEYNSAWEDLQTRAVIEAYGRQELSTPINIGTRDRPHHQQEYRYGGRRYEGKNVSSCVSATAYNALDALGVLRPGETEDDIIRQLGGFEAAGNINIAMIQNLAHDRQLRAVPLENLGGVVEQLKRAGVVAIAAGNHARLISGVRSDGQGNVWFKVNDPLGMQSQEMNPAGVSRLLATAVNDVRRDTGMPSLPARSSNAILGLEKNIQINIRNQNLQNAE